MSGLLAFSQDLQNISNNVANLNTPGFKGSNSQFADMFSGSNGSNSLPSAGGAGVQVLPAVIDFSRGQTTQTGIATNLAGSGDSFFVLKDTQTGQLSYTQNGQFHFDEKGTLVDSTGQRKVQALDANGGLADLSQAGLENSLPVASKAVTLSGNLSTTASPATITPINVIDASGGTHALTAKFTNSTTAPGTWTVSVTDSNGTVASGGSFVFAGGIISGATASNSFSFNYAPAGVAAMPLTLALQPGTTSLASASTLAVQSIDGHLAGTVTSPSFNQNGTLVLNYSNGQTVNGPTVALANFASTANLQQLGGNAFSTSNNSEARLGVAGTDSAWGRVTAGSIQGSNVDLSAEFSNIIITQRGYQAASEIVSTANQMIQNLLDMKGRS
jgi:flagellar hook protein FlgE